MRPFLRLQHAFRQGSALPVVSHSMSRRSAAASFTSSGIKQRHIAADGELTSDLAVQAAERALACAEIDPAEVDAIVLATTTPDETFPATATRVQARLGLTGGFAFDVQAVCSGFVY